MATIVLTSEVMSKSVKPKCWHGTAKWRLMKDCEVGGGLFIPRSDIKGERSRPGIPSNLKSLGQTWTTSIAEYTAEDGTVVEGFRLQRVA